MVHRLLVLALPFAANAQPEVGAVSRSHEWINDLLEAPYEETEGPADPVLQLVHQDFEELERNESILHTPLTIGERRFERGLGWIADAPDFDFERGKEFLNLYEEVRHLLVGAWYPLLPYSRDPDGWTGSQFHRPDLNEGLILLFRHADSPCPAVEVKLRGLDAEAMYELKDTETGETESVKGEELMSGYEVRLGERRESRLLVYRDAVE